MVYVSYLFQTESNRLMEDEARRITLSLDTPRLDKSLRRLLAGEPLTYMVYGDSISTGCEALFPKEAYFSLFARKLELVTGGKVEVVNHAKGGETSRDGEARFAAALESCSPHLVSIAYGVNDMCIKNGRPDLTVEEYRTHIVAMLDMARSRGCEVLLITNCPPNPHWVFTSPGYRDYAAELRNIAREYAAPLADVQALWDAEMAAGKRLSDLLLNDVNHPSSYGHRLYAAMLETIIG